MKEKQAEHSALLGRFVGMVQAMEDALEGATPKSPQWGMEILPLFSANINSTLQIIKNILSHLPEETEINGTIYTTLEALADLQEIDIELLRYGVDSMYYEKGYCGWEKKIKQSHFTMRCSKDEMVSPSYHLGVLLAHLKRMEEAALNQDGVCSSYTMDELLILLDTNLESTLQLLDKVLSSLPETVVFKDSSISLSQLKQVRSYLTPEELDPLDMSEFRRGFRAETLEALL